MTFTGNWVSEDGGGMYNVSSSPELLKVTFIGNQANGEGGYGQSHQLLSEALERYLYQ